MICSMCARCCIKLDVAELDVEPFEFDMNEWGSSGYWYKSEDRNIVLHEPFLNKSLVVAHDLFVDDVHELIDAWQESPNGYWIIQDNKIYLRIPTRCRNLQGKICVIHKYVSVMPRACRDLLCKAAKRRVKDGQKM